MTRDEIRRAIGSYATGSLTESERKALYEAALEDQELFDELAGEHALKELLEEPGTKQRLISALSEATPKTQSVPSPGVWRWGTIAMVTASVVIAIIAGRIALRTKPPVETARMMSAAPQSAQEPVAASPTAPARPMMVAPRPPEKQRFAPATPKEVRKDESRQTAGQLQNVSVAPAPNQVASAGAIGGVVPRAASFKAALMNAPRFAFDYTVENGDALTIKSAAVGYLRIVANSRTGTQVIFPVNGTGRVAIDSVNRLPIPAGAQELIIVLSAQPGSDALPGLPSTSDNPSGTVEDPNPSVDSKLVLTLRLH